MRCGIHNFYKRLELMMSCGIKPDGKTSLQHFSESFVQSVIIYTHLIHVVDFQGCDKIVEALLIVGWSVPTVAKHTTLHSRQQ